MTLKSQEVKTSSDGDSNSELYKMLRTPGVTSDEIESFSNTDAGYAAWTNLGRVPEFMLIEPIYSAIKGSPSAYMALIHDKEIFNVFGDWDPDNFVSSDKALELVNSDYDSFEQWVMSANDPSMLLTLFLSVDAINVIALDSRKCTCFFESEWVKEMCISSRAAINALSYNGVVGSNVGSVPSFIANLFNSPHFSILINRLAFMRSVVETDGGMHGLFYDFNNRKVIWEVGRKGLGDLIMRESAFARQWLWDNVMIAMNGIDGDRPKQVGKLTYVLAITCERALPGYDLYVGNFVGDHRSGTRQVSEVNTKLNRVDERAKNTWFYRNHSTKSTIYTPTLYYVQMEP